MIMCIYIYISFLFFSWQRWSYYTSSHLAWKWFQYWTIGGTINPWKCFIQTSYWWLIHVVLFSLLQLCSLGNLNWEWILWMDSIKYFSIILSLTKSLLYITGMSWFWVTIVWYNWTPVPFLLRYIFCCLNAVSRIRANAPWHQHIFNLELGRLTQLQKASSSSNMLKHPLKYRNSSKMYLITYL